MLSPGRMGEQFAERTSNPWDRNKRSIFDKITANYDKARWGYPSDLITGIVNYSTQQNSKKALEIGAGTGKATSPFLANGYTITAVELGTNMANFLQNKFATSPKFKLINASFEEATLEENTYDLVYAASAFHWVDAEIGCPKVFNILKSGGTFALFRKNSPPAENDDLYDEIQTCYEKHYYSHYPSGGRPEKTTEKDLWSQSELYRSFRFKGMELYGFTDIKMQLYDSVDIYTPDEYIALLETMSDHISLPEANKKSLYSGIREAISSHGGEYKINSVFQLYMGRKP